MSDEPFNFNSANFGSLGPFSDSIGWCDCGHHSACHAKGTAETRWARQGCGHCDCTAFAQVQLRPVPCGGMWVPGIDWRCRK